MSHSYESLGSGKRLQFSENVCGNVMQFVNYQESFFYKIVILIEKFIELNYDDNFMLLIIL